MWWIWLIILAVIVAVIIVLVVLGKKAKKRQAEQEEQIEASKQVLSMLVIDQTPKLMRRSKLPIVKAKVGPKIMTFIADPKVFEILPVKKEIKATVSGLYIVGAKGIRGPLEVPPKKKKKKKKESAFNRLLRKGRGEL